MENIEKSVFALAMAKTIEERGWCRGQYKNRDGKVCLLGAGIDIAKLEGDRGWVEGMRAVAEVFDIPIWHVIAYNDYYIRDTQDAIDQCMKMSVRWARLGMDA